MAQDPQSPLEPCPSTPNCVHEVHTYPVMASELAGYAESALRSLSPESLERGVVDGHAMRAVFKLMFFRDDVAIFIVPDGQNSTLYIRSASRVGHSDLGVNRRRIRRILKRLDRLITNK